MSDILHVLQDIINRIEIVISDLEPKRLRFENDLRDGYYWYYPSGDEKHDDLTGEVKMVEVWNSGLTVSTPGNGEALHITEATGDFLGPLVPPK